MCSAAEDTVSSNEKWKKSGGKTKRGKPVGPREVAEKYKVVGYDTIEVRNLQQLRIEYRVWGYNDPFETAFHAKERRRANTLALQDQLLALEEDKDAQGLANNSLARRRE